MTAAEYRTNRLFDVAGRTSSESARNRAQQLAGRVSLFDLAPSDAAACPACGGLPDVCSCHRTGAQAVSLLELDELNAHRRCYCPDDCGCRSAYRPNVCGCRQHDNGGAA